MYKPSLLILYPAPIYQTVRSTLYVNRISLSPAQKATEPEVSAMIPLTLGPRGFFQYLQSQKTRAPPKLMFRTGRRFSRLDSIQFNRKRKSNGTKQSWKQPSLFRNSLKIILYMSDIVDHQIPCSMHIGYIPSQIHNSHPSLGTVDNLYVFP